MNVSQELGNLVFNLLKTCDWHCFISSHFDTSRYVILKGSYFMLELVHKTTKSSSYLSTLQNLILPRILWVRIFLN